MIFKMSSRFFLSLFFTCLIMLPLLIINPSVNAADGCPCDEIARKLAEAQKKLKALEDKLKQLDKDLKDNQQSQKDADKRIAEIDKEIEKQRNTSASTTDSSGATIETRYDLKTGERVTTRTPRGGRPTEINRESRS